MNSLNSCITPQQALEFTKDLYVDMYHVRFSGKSMDDIPKKYAQLRKDPYYDFIYNRVTKPDFFVKVDGQKPQINMIISFLRLLVKFDNKEISVEQLQDAFGELVSSDLEKKLTK